MENNENGSSKEKVYNLGSSCSGLLNNSDHLPDGGKMINQDNIITNRTLIYGKLNSVYVPDHPYIKNIYLALSEEIKYNTTFWAWMKYDKNALIALNLLSGKELKLQVNEYWDIDSFFDGIKRRKGLTPRSIEVIGFEASTVTDFETAFRSLKESYQEYANKIDNPDEYIRSLRGDND